MAESNPVEPAQEKPIRTRKVGPAGILLRLFLAAITGTIIGAVIYYTAVGWIPYLNQRVIDPIDRNQTAVAELLGTQEALLARISQLQDSLDSQVATLDSYAMELLQLSEDDLALQATVDNNTWFMLQQTQAIATLRADQSSSDRNLAALATAQMAYAGSQAKLDLLKVIDRLSRAHQLLLHANYGLAESELVAAQADLDQMLQGAYGYQQATITELQELIGQVIADLPSRPALAENTLDLAWEVAVQGFPEFSSTGTITPTPDQAPLLTITPTPGND